MNPPDPDLLSINTATLWESCNLRQAVDALRRHNIRGIAPWRDRVAEAGVKEAARMIRDSGLTVTGGDADADCEYLVTFSATVTDKIGRASCRERVSRCV